MAKRNEKMIKVKDPSGELFEVSNANARDLVQHLGWSYVNEITPESLQADLANAPRKKGQAASKVQEARDAATLKKVPDEGIKTVGKKKTKKDAEEQKVAEVVNSTAEEATFDESGAAADLEAELDALEAEEDARGKR